MLVLDPCPHPIGPLPPLPLPRPKRTEERLREMAKALEVEPETVVRVALHAAFGADLFALEIQEWPLEKRDLAINDLFEAGLPPGRTSAPPEAVDVWRSAFLHAQDDASGPYTRGCRT